MRDIMINTSRHREIINPLSYPNPIHIIGAGATGSRLFSSIVELGFTNITVYDDDKVENHNLSNQIFNDGDVNSYKVDALAKWVEGKLGEGLSNITYIKERLPHADILLSGTVFLLTDTMTSRREIYKDCLKDNAMVDRVYETRMASSYGNIFSFNPIEQGEQWLGTLIKDKDAEMSACGSSISVGATAAIIANNCVWQFITSLIDPAAAEDIVDIYLKPFSTSTRSWQK